MTESRLKQIKSIVSDSKEQADWIMDGGDNYDGADGAREVQDLCLKAQELIEALESSATVQASK